MGGRMMDAPGAQDVQQVATAGVVASIASKLCFFSGTGTAIFGTMTSEFFFAAVGAIGTIGTLLINAYYKRRSAKLEQRRMEFEMELVRRAEERKAEVARVWMEAMRARSDAHAPMLESAPAPLSRFPLEGGK